MLMIKQSMQASNTAEEKQTSKRNNEINLDVATWVKEEEELAEERYARFLLLQSLGKRLKKFYKFEFGRDDETHVKNFRKAAEVIPKKVYEFDCSRTPS